MIYIRNLRPGDNINHLFGLEDVPIKWNCEHVYVAEANGDLVGVAIVFDAGHDIVLVDHVRALPPYEGKGLWPRFLKRIAADYKARGRTVLFGYADNQTVLDMAVRFGATEGEGIYRALTIRI